MTLDGYSTKKFAMALINIAPRDGNNETDVLNVPRCKAGGKTNGEIMFHIPSIIKNVFGKTCQGSSSKISIPEACEVLKISRSMIHNWIDGGVLEKYPQANGGGCRPQYLICREMVTILAHAASRRRTKGNFCNNCSMPLADGAKRCDVCKSEFIIQMRGKAAISKAFIDNHLKTHPCVGFPNGCPYSEADPDVLDFDHVVGKKEFDISAARNGKYGIKRLMAEVAKCVVRCANCHRRKTRHDLRIKKSGIVEVEF